MDKIFDQIRKEKAKQNQRWGEQNHNPVEWIAILTEEVGEAARMAVDLHFKNPVLSLAGDLKSPNSENQHYRMEEYRKELIQSAAVIVQAIECLDRNGQ